MYRKEADRLIVRDVRRRLVDLRHDKPWADWRTAVTVSQAQHTDWYSHHMPALYESLQPLLREAGIDMTETEKPFRFVGNIASDDAP